MNLYLPTVPLRHRPGRRPRRLSGLLQLLLPDVAPVGGGPHRLLRLGLERPGVRAHQRGSVKTLSGGDDARTGMDTQEGDVQERAGAEVANAREGRKKKHKKSYLHFPNQARLPLHSTFTTQSTTIVSSGKKNRIPRNEIYANETFYDKAYKGRRKITRKEFLEP